MPRSKEESAAFFFFFLLAFSGADLESEFRAHAKPAARALIEPAARAALDPGRIKFAGAGCESRAGRFSCPAGSS